MATKTKRINYAKVFKDLLDYYEGKKPKPKDYADKIYLVYGALSQVEELKRFQLCIKYNSHLTFKSEKREREKWVSKKVGDEIIKVRQKSLDNYYTKVSLKFDDGFNIVDMIKEIYKKPFLEELDDEDLQEV